MSTKTFDPTALVAPDESRPEVTFTVPNEPVSKSRHRTGLRNGKVYHYQDKKNSSAQGAVGTYYRQARGPCQPAEGGFGVEAVFYVQKRQRRDVDNFIKLVFDGLTGVAWVDDSQVTEVHGKIVHGSDEPRSVIRVFPTDDLPDRMQRTCEHCGKTFRTYSSWATTRKYCSDECRHAAVMSRRERTCKECGGTFHSPTPSAKSPFCSVECKHKNEKVEVTCAHCKKRQVVSKGRARSGRADNFYCDQKCMADYWRLKRKTNAVGECADCGGPTSKKEYTRCRACNLDRMRKSRGEE